MARNMNSRRSIPGRRDASPHSDGLAAMGADAGASVALGGPAPLGYASYEAGGPLDSTLHTYANGAQQQQQHGSAAHTDYSSAQSLSAHGSSPGGASPHAPQASFYNAPGPTGNYGGVEDPHQAPVRGHHLPPLSEALHSSNDAAQAHDDSHRFAHNVGPGGPAYDDQHFLDAHMMHPPANSNPGAGVHDYANGTAASGAPHFQQQAPNGAASSAGMMTPPPGSSHGAGSSHGGYQSHYAPPAHMMHRASISGPVMSHYPTHPSVGGAASALAGHSGIGAPPAAGDFAAWGNASGSARPHTADGMFGGQFGLGAPQWPGALPTGAGYSMRGPRASISSMSSMPDQSPSSIGSKTFSYMAGADDMSGGQGGGSGAKKRPRRRYDEIERLYPCSFPGCAKSYGTLNHLNAHVAMQKHGQKRAPGEFKEMRKQWRKGKREEEQRRQSHGGSDDHMGHRGSISSSYGGTPGPVAHGYPSAGLSGYTPMGMPSQIPRYSMQQGSAGGTFSAMQPPSHYPAQSAPLDPNGRPYSSAGAPPQVQQQQQQQQQHGPPGGLGAYLMAHRGSI